MIPVVLLGCILTFLSTTTARTKSLLVVLYHQLVRVLVVVEELAVLERGVLVSSST